MKNGIPRAIIPVLSLVLVIVGAFSVAPSVPVAHAAQTLTVTSTGSAVALSDCKPATTKFTLGCAITQANGNVSGDTINFNISGGCSNPCVISPSGTGLPTLTASSTSINGYSQTGSSANTNNMAGPDNAVIKIQIDGSQQTGQGGLSISGADDTVEGLSFTNVGSVGVSLEAQSDMVEGDFLCLGPNGQAPTSGQGTEYGVSTYGYSAPGATIGGSTPAEANVISGCTTVGVYGDATADNTISANWIGTNPAGTSAVPNGIGIELLGEAGTTSSHDSILLNVISGNTGWGIEDEACSCASGDVSTSYVSIQANMVGVDGTDSSALPNGAGGIRLDDDIDDQIGGTGAGQQPNEISGNGAPGSDAPGIEITGSLATGNDVAANGIGIIPNTGDGVLVTQGASGNSVNQSNTIANNGGFGVEVGTSPTDPVHVSINQNRLIANALGGIGINGYPQGSCANGPTYTLGTAPNDATPCPIIFAATENKVSGDACTGCTVEVYLSPASGDDEGAVFEGQTTAGVCASEPCTGFSPWSIIPPSRFAATRVVPGKFVTATATSKLTGVAETSEFSRNMPAGSALTVNTTADGAAPCGSAYSLRCAITQANADGVGDEIDFNIPSADHGCVSGICTISPISPLPALTAASTYIDGSSQNGSLLNGSSLGNGDAAAMAVDLSGSSATTGNGLVLAGAYDIASGLDISSFPAAGVSVTGTNDSVAGNFIGIAPNGAKAPNDIGVEIGPTGEFTTIGGRGADDANVLSGNHSYGVLSSGPGQNTIRQNLIGVNVADATSMPNGYDGVLLLGTTDDTVGGIRSNEGNVISGNVADGIAGLDAQQATIAGNEIGVDGAADSNKVGNGVAGVSLYLGANNLVGDLPFASGVCTPAGSVTKHCGNVVAGNGGDGIDIMAEDGDVVGGNIVGYSGDGNSGNGIMFAGLSYVTGLATKRSLGAAFSGGRFDRLVTGRRMHARGSSVVGGENPSGSMASTNVIQDNGLDGILIGQSAADADTIVQATTNSINLNNQHGAIHDQGIKLQGTTEVLGTGACSGPSLGPNGGIPCPSINSATLASNTITVSGAGCSYCIVEVFGANTTACAGSGPYFGGEGATYLGSAPVVAAPGNKSGAWSLQANATATGVGAAQCLTATATRCADNCVGSSPTLSQCSPPPSGPAPQCETSEFGPMMPVEVSGSVRRTPLAASRPVPLNWRLMKRLYFAKVPTKLPRANVRFRP